MQARKQNNETEKKQMASGECQPTREATSSERGAIFWLLRQVETSAGRQRVYRQQAEQKKSMLRINPRKTDGKLNIKTGRWGRGGECCTGGGG
jgi:hypothetical protein